MSLDIKTVVNHEFVIIKKETKKNMSEAQISKGIGGVVNKITANGLFKGALVILGIAFTVSTVINNSYSIRWHKMNIREKEEKERIEKAKQ